MRDLALLIKHPGRRKQLLDAALRDLDNENYHFVSPVYEPMKPTLIGTGISSLHKEAEMQM